ncbi:MAG: transcriptional regulator NrdR [Betaproteobacteria bacterium]|nr:transcriptional regulator NrdR [Betaproteobacteria bacterium]
MKCPFCQHPETQVVETREVEDGTALRRRRRCAGCDKRFTTYERAEVSFPAVVKKDGRRMEYSRDKLSASLALALRKRPVAAEEVDAAIGRIEQRLLQTGARELESAHLGEWVMDELKRLDEVAYVRFASVYRSFKDPAQFVQILEEMARSGQSRLPPRRSPRAGRKT